jgi:hypothetical protein
MALMKNAGTKGTNQLVLDLALLLPGKRDRCRSADILSASGRSTLSL